VKKILNRLQPRDDSFEREPVRVVTAMDRVRNERVHSGLHVPVYGSLLQAFTCTCLAMSFNNATDAYRIYGVSGYHPARHSKRFSQ